MRIRNLSRGLRIGLFLVTFAAQLFPSESQQLFGAQSPDATSLIYPGDLLDLAVFDEPEMKQSIRVNSAGFGEVFLLGNLKLGGMTTIDAQRHVATELVGRQLLRHPQVSIIVKEFATSTASIIGEVQRPGVYDIRRLCKLQEVLSQAGGLTSKASGTFAIRRRTGEEIQATTSTLGGVGGFRISEVEVLSGDAIVAHTAQSVFVVGDVVHAGEISMKDAHSMTIVQAIALAGGIKGIRPPSKIHIVRKTISGYSYGTINLTNILVGRDPDTTLAANDVLYIPPGLP